MAADSSPDSIDHVGLAVADLAAAVAFYERVLGRRPSHREEVAADSVEAVFFDLGGSSLELLSSTDSNSSVGRFLERRGPGLHHLGYLVPDIVAELERWQGWGAELVDREPRLGARARLVAFVHPRSAGGVLTELCQIQPGLR